MQQLGKYFFSGDLVSSEWRVRLIKGIGVLLTLISLGWAAELHRRAGLILYTEQFLVIALGLTLAMTYLMTSSGGDKTKGLRWYDAIAVSLSIGLGLYVAVYFASLVNELSYRPLYLVIMSAAIVILVIEGLRRLVGWPLTIVVLSFVLYGMFGHLIPGQLSGRPVSYSRLALYLGLDSNGILGLPLIVGATIVIPFIFFGQILSKSGGSDFFTDLSVSLMGRFRGGSAKIAVFASALFGAISGSAVSNVATTGVITIPLMTKSGYRARVAAAIEAVASTGGQLMPPIMGAAAFLMAEFLEIPYSEVVLAATFPAFLYFFTLFLQVDLEAASQNVKRIEDKDILPVSQVLATGWHFPVPFVVLVVALFKFNFSPAASVLMATAVLLFTSFIIGYKGKRMKLSDLLTTLAKTGQGVTDLILICAGAGIVIGILNLSGLGFGLTLSLVNLGGGNLILLLFIAAVISIILGMGMPTVGVYVLLATLVAPALIEVGVEPIAAHMFVLYFGMMSMITPPVALAAFAGASIAGSEPMRTGMTAIRFAWSAYIVPFLFIFSPGLLLLGDLSDILTAGVAALGGIWLITSAIVGYLSLPLKLTRRIMVMGSGIAILTPMSIHPAAFWVVITGGVIGACLVLFCYFDSTRRLRTNS